MFNLFHQYYSEDWGRFMQGKQSKESRRIQSHQLLQFKIGLALVIFFCDKSIGVTCLSHSNTNYANMKIPRITSQNLCTLLQNKVHSRKGIPTLFQSMSSSDSQNLICQSAMVGHPVESTTRTNNPISNNNVSSHHITQNIIKPLTNKKNEFRDFSTSTATHNVSTQHQENLYKDHFTTLFSLDLPEGKCVGLHLSSSTTQNQTPDKSTSLCPSQIESNDDHWIKKLLHPEEVKFGTDLPSETARLSFFIGRLAMRTALILSRAGCDTDNIYNKQQYGEVNVGCEDRTFNGFVKLPIVLDSDPSILKDQHGRPQVPKGYIGSISHKKTTGVALVSNIPYEENHSTRPKIGIGVDIEQTFSRRRSIATKILTSKELENLGNLKGVTKDEEVLLRFRYVRLFTQSLILSTPLFTYIIFKILNFIPFNIHSLKECVYKAMHPLISQRVGFQEAEIQPHDDGTATVTLNLKSSAHEQFDTVKANWRRIDGEYFLTSSSVTIKD